MMKIHSAAAEARDICAGVEVGDYLSRYYLSRWDDDEEDQLSEMLVDECRAVLRERDLTLQTDDEGWLVVARMND